MATALVTCALLNAFAAPLFAISPGAAAKGRAPRPGMPAGPVLAHGPEPYCGIYCVYRAMRAVNVPIQVSDLIRPKYISSRRGSSVDDLVAAATDHGVQAVPVGRLTCRMLAHVDRPAILLVKNHLAETSYNHWVLFLGLTDEEDPLIADGESTGRPMAWADLAARWDGTAVLISPDRQNMFWLWASGVQELLGYVVAGALVLACLFAVAAIPLVGRLRARIGSSVVAQSVLLVAMAILASGGARYVVAPGWMSYKPAITAIQDSHIRAFVAKVSAAQVNSLLAEEGVTFVDARQPQDYSAGHVAGAINVPPSHSPFEARQAMKNVPKTDRIVVYAHSNGCVYGDRVAQTLRSDGYERIVFFEDGWVGWQRWLKEAGGKRSEH